MSRLVNKEAMLKHRLLSITTGRYNIKVVCEGVRQPDIYDSLEVYALPVEVIRMCKMGYPEIYGSKRKWFSVPTSRLEQIKLTLFH